MIRFNENEIRVMGRTASGVKGIEVDEGHTVGCEIAESGEEILVVTENDIKMYNRGYDNEKYRKNFIWLL